MSDENAPTNDTSTPVTDDTSAAPAKKTTRKRAAKKTAAAPAESGPVVAAGGSAEAGAAVPAKKTTRKRAAKKTAAAPAESGPVDAAPGSAEASTTEPAPSAAATTAPLFQAPDPAKATATRRRTRKSAESADDAAGDSRNPAADAPAATATTRKRATRPAGPPTSRPSTNSADGSAASVDADPPEGTTGSAGDGTGEQDSGSGSSGRRRRRRGGRRHKRSSGDEGENGRTDDASDGDGSAQEGPAEKPGDTTPAQGTDRSGDENQGEDTDGEASGSGDDQSEKGDGESSSGSGSRRRRRRRRRKGESADASPDDPENTVTKVRESRSSADQVTALEGSTRLQAKKQRRRENREAGRRRPNILTESEFLARRESVERVMAVRQRGDLTQIAVLEDGVLVEHYVSQATQTSQIGNVYLGRVQNVLPSMEAAFVDIGKGRNAVLYAGEVDWAGLGAEGQPRRIEVALKSGQSVLVQVSKDPIGHKGARLTSQISLAGRYVVFVPGGGMSGISRKLPDTERTRLKEILKGLVPDGASVVVRTAAEGATEEELRGDVERLQKQWADIEAQSSRGQAPKQLYAEPDLLLKVVRDLFNSDFSRLEVSGPDAGPAVQEYVNTVAPHLADRVERSADDEDVFAKHSIDDQIAKALQRKVWLPSGGSLVIDRTEAMTVIDVNTGKFTGSGGSLEETVTKNNLEAAEEIVRQLRLRDLGGIVVIDFIDMVLEANRDLVLRRLVECLGRDRTKHQVAEVTSLGLVQMTRKRIGIGLLEAFSEPCAHCGGRGVLVHDHPTAADGGEDDDHDEHGDGGRNRRHRSGRRGKGDGNGNGNGNGNGEAEQAPAPKGPNPAEIIAAAAARSRSASHDDHPAAGDSVTDGSADPVPDADGPEAADSAGTAPDASDSADPTPGEGAGQATLSDHTADVQAEPMEDPPAAPAEADASSESEDESPSAGPSRGRRLSRRGRGARLTDESAADPLADGNDPSDYEPTDLDRSLTSGG